MKHSSVEYLNGALKYKNICGKTGFCHLQVKVILCSVSRYNNFYMRTILGNWGCDGYFSISTKIKCIIMKAFPHSWKLQDTQTSLVNSLKAYSHIPN